MRVLTTDPPPAEVETLLERRRQAGIDRFDEIWDGVLHMAPMAHSRHGEVQAQLFEFLGPLARSAGLSACGEFNLGEQDDFRVPDGGLLPRDSHAVFHQTAPLVLEVLSPADETWEKLPFYAAHNVDEVLIADPDAQKVTWLALTGGEYHPVERSTLIDLGPARLAELISWPAAG